MSATLRTADRIAEDPIDFWLSRLDKDSQKSDRSQFKLWMQWLHAQPNWETVTPRDLLIRQLENADKYVILDLLQNYIKNLVLRKASKRKAYSAIRSFFAHNRCELPKDPTFRIRGDKPPVQAKLTTADIVEVATAANLVYRSMIVFKWESFLDSSRLIYVNVHCSEQILKQLKADIHPVRIDLPGRKSNENDTEGQFYTYIGADAKTALIEYFEKARGGWPRPGDPLWIYGNGDPVQKAELEARWLALLRRTGKIPQAKGPPGNRTGLNLHEFRDLAVSRLHMRRTLDSIWIARNSGVDKWEKLTS